MHTIARDIFDIFVVHDRIDQAVSEEILVHIVMDLFPLHGRQFQSEILHNLICSNP